MRATFMLCAPSRHPTQPLQATGEPVTDALELAKPEQAGTADARALNALRARCGDIGEGVGQDSRKLSLELCDLLLQ